MSYLELINDAWSRGFNHENYIHYANRVMEKTGNSIHLVTAPVYKLICEGLTLDMEQNIGCLQPASDDQPSTNDVPVSDFINYLFGLEPRQPS